MFSFRGYYDVIAEPAIGFINSKWLVFLEPSLFLFCAVHGWDDEKQRI